MNNTKSKTLLMSIRPKYAEKIFGGTKKVELRRTKSRLESGDTVLIYVSSPVKALMGLFQVRYVAQSSPKQLWKQVQCVAGITQTEFYEYYTGTELATGIFFESVQSIKTPVSLKALKDIWNNFHPPQTYKYIDEAQLEALSYLNPALTAAAIPAPPA